MASIMGACARASCVLTLFLWLVPGGNAAADFKVTDVTPRIVDQSLAVSGDLDLELTSKVQEALGKGVPIEVVIDIDLYRMRAILWDARVANWVLHRRISYHALSRQYLVTGHKHDADAIESFTSLQAALASMGLLDDLKFPLKHQLQTDSQYYVSVRASLDIDSLPALLRPVAYTSLAWRLSSGWTRWNVQH
jgi:hypothetical protein